MPMPCAIVLAFLLMCLTGCGLKDYEERTDRQRARLLDFDEENKYLGEMLELPRPSKEFKSLPFTIFLRLPRGITPVIAADDGVYSINGLSIYRYPGPTGYNVFLAAASAEAGDQPKDTKNDEGTLEDFRNKFQRALGKILKTSFSKPAVERLVRPATSPTGEKLPDLVFDYFVLEEEAKRNEVPKKKNAPSQEPKNATSVGVYIHQHRQRIVALAFQVPLTHKNDRAVGQGIDWCLKSLDVSANAAAKRIAYAKYKRLD